MSYLKQTFTIAFQLSSVGRFSRDHMVKPESVLEHIGFCTFYASLLGQQLSRVEYIDFALLMPRVAFHDVDEALLGDVPRTTKYFSHEIRYAFNEAENQTVTQIGQFVGSNELPINWRMQKDGLEGQILKVADIAAVVYKNWAEIELLGNRSFVRVALETKGYLEGLNPHDFHSILWQELEEIRKLNNSLLEGKETNETDVLFLNFKKGK